MKPLMLFKEWHERMLANTAREVHKKRLAIRIRIGRWLIVLLCLAIAAGALAQQATPNPTPKHVAVFFEASFPAADSATPTASALQSLFQAATLVDISALKQQLSNHEVSLLVLPYGSAFPEEAWPQIFTYLEAGGNLLVIGGQPFTRAAYRDGQQWKLRNANAYYPMQLFIDDYQQTPGSQGLQFEPNPDTTPTLPAFQWKRAFSPVIRLSVNELYRRSGSTGDTDAVLETLAWGSAAGHRRAAPVIEIDHDSKRFTGGRWIFVACELADDFFAQDSARKLLPELAAIATRRGDRFTFRPAVPLFLAGEQPQFNFEIPGESSGEIPGEPSGALPAESSKTAAPDSTSNSAARTATSPQPEELRVTVEAESGAKPIHLKLTPDSTAPMTLPPSILEGTGFHTVTAQLFREGKAVRTYRSGFWLRDWKYLSSGPRLGVGSDYFTLDGAPLPAIGTTYMSSDVQRLFLLRPNAYVWQQDMAQIHGAGLNMLRTGIWSAWDRMLAPDGSVSESTLRSVEAFLMCARHNNLPVQFNIFAFLPETVTGTAGFTNPVALRAQQRFTRSIAQRFRDVPFLAWDLVNEPSFNQNLWATLPATEDPYEASAWRAWVTKKYPDQAGLLAAWGVPAGGTRRAIFPQQQVDTPAQSAADPLALPTAHDFLPDSVRTGFNPLKVYDYYLFTEDTFTDWVAALRGTIRDTGSKQLITVGQEERGLGSRLSPVFYASQVDFTADHTWWDTDSILWASLVAKIPGKPMLIQETGEQRRLEQDAHLRLSAEVEGWQIERKLALSLAEGAGALEWLWNVNAYMPNDNEISIGAVRVDGTEKLEADVLGGFAVFVGKHPEFLTTITPPETVVLAPQAMQFSGMNDDAVLAQQRAIRALCYADHMPARMVAENRIDELGTPKLVILPSPQALLQDTWTALLAYVDQGGHLAITGPVGRDEHWQTIDRLTSLGVSAKEEPLIVDETEFNLPGDAGVTVKASYPYSVQMLPIAVLNFADGQRVHSIAHGKGTILWASDPLEMAGSYEAAAAFYKYALAQASVAPVFNQLTPLSDGVLAFPTILPDAVLYSFANDSLSDHVVDIKDTASGARISFTLKAQRGAAALLKKSNGQLLAKYGY